MKRIVAAALALAALASSAQAAPICIDSIRIRSTTVPDSKHILFHMTDGTTWSNALRNSCPALRFNGFVYSPVGSREVCENLQTVYSIDDGSPCMLGKFTKVPKKTA